MSKQYDLVGVFFIPIICLDNVMISAMRNYLLVSPGSERVKQHSVPFFFLGPRSNLFVSIVISLGVSVRVRVGFRVGVSG